MNCIARLMHIHATPQLFPLFPKVCLTVSPPANGCSFNQHALVVPVQKVLQVLLFFGLGAQFQINVVGKVCEIAKTFLSTAHTVPREPWKNMHKT